VPKLTKQTMKASFKAKSANRLLDWRRDIWSRDGKAGLASAPHAKLNSASSTVIRPTLVESVQQGNLYVKVIEE
jgi:hypothetical protein